MGSGAREYNYLNAGSAQKSGVLERKIMARILCSTGALIGRPNGRDFRLLKPLSEKLNCDGFEFMMYSDWYDKTDEIVAFTKDIGLKTPCYHCQKSIGEAVTREDFEDAFSRFGINAAMAERMGARKLILHLWDGILSDSNFDSNLRAYAELRKIAEAHGLDLLVENVVCNVGNPMLRWSELVDRYPDIHFVFDTKMAAFHGQLEQLYSAEGLWLTEHDHIRHYHVNDYGGGYMDWANLRTLPIGAGNIDFNRFLRFIKKTGYDDTFTLESTAFNQTGAVDTDMLNRETEFLRIATNLSADTV